MNKLAECINRDIYALTMYKLANWIKIAEGEPVPPPPPEQEPEPTTPPTVEDFRNTVLSRRGDRLNKLPQILSDAGGRPLEETQRPYDYGMPSGPRNIPIYQNIRTMEPRDVQESMYMQGITDKMTLPLHDHGLYSHEDPVGLDRLPQNIPGYMTNVAANLGAGLPPGIMPGPSYRNRNMDQFEDPRYRGTTAQQFHRLWRSPYSRGFENDIMDSGPGYWDTYLRKIQDPNAMIRRAGHFY